ncbi:hypothetical protein [Lutibacter flavus]|uniref:Uncharacterized protein n=1 Tax=Lutibacter flavus TaxID=691689 RepID=A0A238VNW6_9FLAO|nr:hypothetical protein [Lutibacter flavus]SNR36045.1 hypothetical protein SAMN04488111_0808 [Lutibacter flavus]
MITKLTKLKVVSETTLVPPKKMLQITSNSKFLLKLNNVPNFVISQFDYFKNQDFSMYFLKSSRNLFIATSMFPQR